MLGMLSLTLLAISFTTVTIASPGIVEDIKNREYRIEKDVVNSPLPLPETDDLGLPKEVGQASIHSLIGLYEKLHLLVFGVQEPSGFQASLYSLLFGADGPPLASDEDLSAKLEILSKTIFDGCDKNQDGGLEISEFSLESLLRPPFLRSFSRIIFDLIKQGLAVTSSLLDPNSSGPAQGANSTSLDFKQFSRVAKIVLRAPKQLLALFPAFDRNMDGEVELKEVEQLILFLSCRIRDIQESHWAGIFNAHRPYPPRFNNWLVGLPDNKMISLVVLHLYLAPMTVTLPRGIFASLLTATDTNKDGKMTWTELHNLTDFHLVTTTWAALLEEAREDQLYALAMASMLDVPLRPDEIFREMTTPSNLIRMFITLVYDESKSSKTRQQDNKILPC